MSNNNDQQQPNRSIDNRPSAPIRLMDHQIIQPIRPLILTPAQQQEFAGRFVNNYMTQLMARPPPPSAPRQSLLNMAFPVGFQQQYQNQRQPYGRFPMAPPMNSAYSTPPPPPLPLVAPPPPPPPGVDVITTQSQSEPTIDQQHRQDNRFFPRAGYRSDIDRGRSDRGDRWNERRGDQQRPSDQRSSGSINRQSNYRSSIDQSSSDQRPADRSTNRRPIDRSMDYRRERSGSIDQQYRSAEGSRRFDQPSTSYDRRSQSINNRQGRSSSIDRRPIDRRLPDRSSDLNRYRSRSPAGPSTIGKRKQDQNLPASYRPKDAESKIDRDDRSMDSDSGSDVDLDSRAGGSDEQNERARMSTMDFEGVGSDVSDTEEEDNALGATEADPGRWVQCAQAKLYFQRDTQNPGHTRATERMESLQDEFQRFVLMVNKKSRLSQPQLQPPSPKPITHRCCHHGGHKSSDSSSSSSSSDDSDSSLDSEWKRREKTKKKKKKEKKTKAKKRKKKCERHSNCDSSADGSMVSSEDVSSEDSDSSSDGNDLHDDTEHERFKLAVEEMERKQTHPARLHSELWFNEAGQMNDGPLCRCSWKARQSGIAHSMYPGEKEIEPCDRSSNNLSRLHHYRIVITPSENIKGKIATSIEHDGHQFQFEGFSILSHRPLPENLPVCRVVRWNIEYSIMFSKEEAPELFTIRDTDLFYEYLFVELLELYDLQLKPTSSSETCPIFHVLPRFVRNLEEGGQEILPSSHVIKYLLNNYRPLIDEEDAERLDRWPRERWDALVERAKDQIITNPCKRPSAMRVDMLDRDPVDGSSASSSVDNPDDDPDSRRYPLVVHFGVRPAVLTYTGNPEYQKAWKQYVKFRHLLMMKAKLTTDDRAKLAQKEEKLQQFKAKASLKRDVTVEVSSKGFYTTGIYTDVVQHALMLLVAFCHVRFHWSLRTFEEDRIQYKFKNRALLELAFTHPSYRQNYGTNPDHARNTLSNCGIRQPEYGNKRMQHVLSRKRGINTLIDIMSRMGSKKVKQSQVTNNERLEYLGDAVIEFLSTIHLFHMFPDLQEGGLATYRASLVQNKHLAVLAKKLGMDDYMLYAHGPDLCHEADLKHAMANAFEAVMGAMFLDGGVDVVDRVFGEALFKKEDDPKLHHVWFNLNTHPLQQQEPAGDRHWIDQVDALKKLTDFETQTGIRFKHIRLLARAFTRKNMGYTYLTLGHNQRLEFLGDTVLQLITSEYLYKHFPEHHEGHLSLLRSCLVNNKTQSVICDDLGMTKYVLHPPACQKTGPPELRMKDKADLVESFIGALYVDRGLEFCKTFCKVCFYPRLKYFIMSQKWNDPKSQLQQCCLTLRNPDGGEPDIPTYKVISVEGPTNTRSYKVAVYFKGQRLAAGLGHSVQEAEMKAAEEALRKRADLFPHLEKQRYFIENRFRRIERIEQRSVRDQQRRSSIDRRRPRVDDNRRSSEEDEPRRRKRFRAGESQ